MTDTQATVFILDDDPAIQDSLSMMLNSMNFATECYSSACEYLDSFDASRKGCLIIDIRLPGMSGLECLEKLREIGSQLPVIVVTGHGDQAVKEKAVEFGAIAFLSKPASGSELCGLIKQVL